MSDNDKVGTYDGHRGATAPRSVGEGEDRDLVVDLIEQWIEAGPVPGGPALRCFKVLLESGRVMELALDEGTGEWTVRQS